MLLRPECFSRRDEPEVATKCGDSRGLDSSTKDRTTRPFTPRIAWRVAPAAGRRGRRGGRGRAGGPAAGRLLRCTRAGSSALLSAVPPAAEQLTCQGVAALAKTAFDYANRAAEVIIKDPKKKYRAGDAGRE